MRTFSFAFLIFLACHSVAQQSTTDSLHKVTSFKVSLLDMLEPNSNTFLLSYEFHLGPNVSLLSEGGFIAGKYKNDKAHGYKIREELRWLLPPKPRRRGYVGLQYMHKNFLAKDLFDEFVNRKNGRFEYLDYNYLKKIDAFHMTLGFIKAGFGRQVVDLGCFVGARRIASKAVGLSNEWSLRNEGDPHIFDILFQPSGLPSTKTYLSMGIYLRYGFRVGSL